MEHRFPSKLDEYYEKFLDLQEKLKRSEEQRFLLETQFNETVQMAKEEERAHYRKLRAQYKRFLEEDRKRQDRNERIMRHLGRIETRIATLSAKTERINLLRRQYQHLLVPNQLPAPRTSQPDRSTEDTIRILDKYLQAMSRPSGSDILRLAEPLEPSPNQAAAYADGILSSICSRHYSKDLHLVRGPNQAAEVETRSAPDAVEEVPHLEPTQAHVQLPHPEPAGAAELLQEITVVGSGEPDQSGHQEQATPEHVRQSVDDSPEPHQDSCQQGLLQQPKEALHPTNQTPADREQELCQPDEPLDGKTEPNDPQKLDEEQELYRQNEETEPNDPQKLGEKPELYRQTNQAEPNDQQNVDEEPELYRQNEETEPNDPQKLDEEPELYRQNNQAEPNDQQKLDEEPELYRQNNQAEPNDQQNVDEEPELYRQNNQAEPNDHHNVEEEQEIPQQMIGSDDQPLYEPTGLYQQNEQPEYEETAGYDQYGQLLLYNQHGELVPPQYDSAGQILPQYDSEGLPLTLYDQNGQQYDHNRQPVVHYDANGQPVYEYYTGEEIPQYGLEDGRSNQYYAEKDQSGGLEEYGVNEGYFSQPHADGAHQVAENQLQRDEDPESTEVAGESHCPPHLEPPADAEALEESESNGKEPEPETIPDACRQPDQENAEQHEPQSELVAAPPLGPNKEPEMSVLDILDTDSENSKRNISKVSHDSDFDFS
ncbi:involucrin-like [Dendroctonus ponderosae]|uniref:involucrin-like n=1 Tax=Dendroctonus ponderosae TaxID=77166 RepID=UPI002036590F|nr:involucrin-like [Dendroctonus ponderosae]KAH1018198.1 hypothetical protein HUJ05_006011 [Dendroctonus ponderosae]